METWLSQDNSSYFIGKQLVRDVHTEGGLLLVSKDTVLEEKEIKQLLVHGCELLGKDVRSVGKLAEDNNVCQEQVTTATLRMQVYFDEIRENQRVPVEDIRKNVLPHIQQAADHPHLYGLLNNLQAKDDYTYRHNIGVGVLSSLLGRWLELSEDDITELTMAATLHDVGKMMVPLEVLNKPGKLTKEEFELVRMHPVHGYELLKKTPGTTELERLVALQHHEREDGSGYPLGISGDKIQFFSKIVAVCDVYHAMSSKRCYHEPAPFYQILNQISNNRFGEFDPQIVGVFLDHMMRMMVGNEVQLSDGSIGTIVMIYPSDPLHPLVKVAKEFHDLRSSPLKIMQVLT